MKQILEGFGLFAGASYPIRTLKFLANQPRLWQYLIIPILLNLIIGIIIYIVLLLPSWEIIQGVIINLSAWIDRSIADLPSWLAILEYLVMIVGWLVKTIILFTLFVIIGFIIAQFGGILGAPWYGKLSEEIEKIKTNQVEIIEVNIIIDIWRAILFEIKKLGLMVVVSIPLLLFNLVPGLGNLIAAIGGVTLTATIVCLDFLDAPLERRRLRFRQKLSLVYRGLPATAGFSLVCLGLISIPLLNLIIIPICVASGTLFFCDRLLHLVKQNSEHK